MEQVIDNADKTEQVNSHGGAREGAGRKPKPDFELYTCYAQLLATGLELTRENSRQRGLVGTEPYKADVEQINAILDSIRREVKRESSK